MSEDFFSAYLSYTEGTEPPTNYHRWCIIAAIGAHLARDYAFPHGHFTIYPNLYCMLIGESGDRKSTAIKMAKQFILTAGYPAAEIAADKTSKEKFLMDLAGIEDNGGKRDETDILEQNIFGDDDAALESKPPARSFIMADEFNEFMGNGNIEFISMLGNLWDYNGVYKSRVKNSQSVAIPNPTISILGGNTPTNFTMAFPPETLGQGFFSRNLLIYGEPSGRKITFPKKPLVADTVRLAELFSRIKLVATGIAKLTPTAEMLLDKIYHSWEKLVDVRFAAYSNRRFAHLLKLCLVFSAARFSCEITEADVIYANTVLSHAESFMPKAMGEFGKARNSDVVHKIVQYLDKVDKPAVFKDVWKQVKNDLDKMQELTTILSNLLQAEVIQQVNGGFLRKKTMSDDVATDTLDFSLLTQEERNMTK